VSFWAPAATCLFVTIQPFESKMTPEPTPDCGTPENGSLGSAAAPLTAIVTMAGETFSAARVIAELSSIEMGSGWVACWAWPTGELVATSRSRVPVAESTP
jgi:hypothetical protein